MSTYTEKIDNHPIHTNLKDILDELWLIEGISDKPPVAIETLARISFIIENFSLALETCNKNLTSITWLDESNRALSNIKSYLMNYKSNKDANSLSTNCLAQLDILLQASTKMNCVKSEKNLQNIITAENEYTRIMDLHNKQLHEKVASLEKEIGNLEKRIEDHNITSQKNLSDLQSIINSEKQRLDGFATMYQKQIAEDHESFLIINDKLKESFKEEKTERNQIFNEEIEKIKSQATNIDKNVTKQLKENEMRSNQLIDDYKKKFDEYEEQVKNIVGIVNTNMFSHKYKEVADDAHKRARIWHILAVIFIIAVGGFAFYAFVITVHSDTSWVKLVAKIFATTTFITGAAYAARQASKQEKVERYSRKIEMELVAIDPFIDSLDNEKKSLIKEEIARKIFGNSDAMEIDDKNTVSTTTDKLTSIDKALNYLITLIEKLSK